jgi:hypothetical protein
VIDCAACLVVARLFDRERLGEVISFRCYGANLWPVWLASFVLPNLGIWLKRE